MNHIWLTPRFAIAGSPFTPNPALPGTTVPGGRIRHVRIPADLYDSFLRLYRRSLQLANQMERTLDDGEHILYMEEGREQLKNLPDDRIFRDEIAAYKSFLKEFDPFRAVHLPSGNVQISTQTARSFVHMAHYTGYIVETAFNGVFHTQYLDGFTDLKKLGIAYAGPSALQETMNAYTGLFHIHGKVHSKEKGGLLKKDWYALVFFNLPPAPVAAPASVSTPLPA